MGDVSPALLIITLNVNVLKISIKGSDWKDG